MAYSLLNATWENSIGQQDLLYTCVGSLRCDDIVRHARPAEVAITPRDEDTPRWKLRATGFDGVLVSRTGTNILCQAGRLLRPIKIYYGTDGYYPEGAQVTTVAVDSRTTSLWKESFHLLGLRYSWKYVDGRFYCYSVKPRKHFFKLPPQHSTVAEYYPPRGGIGKRMPPDGPRILGQLITYNVDEALLQHVLVLSAFNFYARFKWAKGRETLEWARGQI